MRPAFTVFITLLMGLAALPGVVGFACSGDDDKPSVFEQISGNEEQGTAPTATATPEPPAENSRRWCPRRGSPQWAG